MTPKQNLHTQLAQLLAGQRKQLKQDRKVIDDFREDRSTSNTVALSVRSNNRFVSLAKCLMDVVQFVDGFLADYQEEASLKKEYNKLKREYEELQAGYKLAKKMLKRQASELAHLQEVCARRKRKIEHHISAIQRLNDKVDILKKRDRAYRYLHETKAQTQIRST
jgi:chromosome segregation ATPase